MASTARRPAPARRVGRPPRGDREPYTLRLPKDHRALYEAAAAEAGYDNLGDYLVVQLAHAHDLPEPSYINTNRDQSLLDVAV